LKYSRFYERVKSWAILPSKMLRRLEPNLLGCDVNLCVQVCLPVPCYFGEIQKLRKCRDSEKNSFGNLSSSSDKRYHEEGVEDISKHKLEPRVVVTWRSGRAIWMPFCRWTSSTLRARKINSFHRRHLKFWDCVTLYFHIIRKIFSLHRLFNRRYSWWSNY